MYLKIRLTIYNWESTKQFHLTLYKMNSNQLWLLRPSPDITEYFATLVSSSFGPACQRSRHPSRLQQAITSSPRTVIHSWRLEPFAVVGSILGAPFRKLLSGQGRADDWCECDLIRPLSRAPPIIAYLGHKKARETRQLIVSRGFQWTIFEFDLSVNLIFGEGRIERVVN